MDGIGVYDADDGRKYVGEWMKGKMHGKGVYIWPNNRIYEG